MKRLSIALSVLLSANLLTLGIRYLVSVHRFPLVNLILPILIGLGAIALVYFSTLEASPLYSLYHREAKVYSAALGFSWDCSRGGETP